MSFWIVFAVGLFTLNGVVQVDCVPVKSRANVVSEFKVNRSPSISDRPGCQPESIPPANRVNTTERLQHLREQIRIYGLKAYIITSDNAHQNEMVGPYDQRREFISGFTGSAGTTVVTDVSAALWTDSRYFIQAEQQLDCNWILMKQGEAGVPTITDWLKEILTVNDQVAADPTLIGADSWMSYRDNLAPIPFNPLSTNLIDEIWNESNGRPSPNLNPPYVLPLTYSGTTWEDKVSMLRNELIKQNVDAIVITALDEVAWLLNMRGYDIPYEPMFLSYMLVSMNDIALYFNTSQLTPEIQNHLNVHNCASKICVRTYSYGDFVNDLPTWTSSLSKILIPSRYSYTGGSSFAVYNAIAQSKRISQTSPVLLLKAKKNTIESNGMMNAHLKDAVANCDCISQIEEEVLNGVSWDELKVSDSLLQYRSQQTDNKGASFESIVGFGPNGAIIHYAPTPETNAIVDNSSLLLIDSGGQYLDGTTDTTRTFHFGNPTAEQKEHYTRVLAGHVDLARAVIPRTVKDTRIDILARRPLYDVGLDFLHGTGHGVGSFLSVHESPTYVGIGGREENRFEENYFFSDEPGYYREGEYGIRIESVLRVVPTSFQTEFPDRFYTFEPATLVPFENKLIAPHLLDANQVKWINNYHLHIREVVGSELQRQNRTRAYNWLISETEPIVANSIH